MAPFFERYRDIIPEFPLFEESLQRPVPVHLRINTLKIEPTALFNTLSEKGIPLKRSSKRDPTLFYAPGLDSPGNLLEYFLGYIHPQAYTSCLASLALCPEREGLVLDMCASPGGKTSHIAQLMENTGLIIANELYPDRHVPLGHTLNRLGVLNTVITAYQAQQFPLRHRFDRILLDAPCSGEGTFRNLSPEAVYRPPRKENRFPDLQKRMILRGFDLLDQPGEMVYATCTFNPRENEGVVNFLLQNRDACLLPIDVGCVYEPGISGWREESYDRAVENSARFYPHRNGSVGFFMARIGRRG